MIRRIRDYYNEYETAIPRIFRYQLLTKAVVLPIGFASRWLLNWLIAATGIDVISNANWTQLLLHPATLLLLGLFLVLAIFYTVIDVNAIILLCSDVLEGRRRNTFELIQDAVKDLAILKRPSGFFLVLYITLSKPLTGVGISVTLTEDFYALDLIPRLAGKNNVLLAVLLSVMLTLTLVAFFYLYTTHFVILGKKEPIEAFRHSSLLVRLDFFGSLRNYIFMLLGITLPSFVVTWIFRNLLPELVFAFDGPLEVSFALCIFGIFCDYNFRLLVAPLHVLRLTSYYLSRVQPDRQIRPKRDKRTWLLTRTLLYAGLGVLIAISVTRILPLLHNHVKVAPYEGGVVGELPDTDEKAIEALFGESQTSYWHVDVDASEEDLLFMEEMLEAAKNTEKTVLFELSGADTRKENVDKLCNMIVEKEAVPNAWVVLDSAEILSDRIQEWSLITMGLRITDILGNLGALGADFYILEERAGLAKNIASLNYGGSQVILCMDEPTEDSINQFSRLWQYPHFVLTKEPEAFQGLVRDLDGMRGDEWVFRLLMG